MYTIALIDDEDIVREGIRDLIPWNSLGLELIGECEDGEEGLLLIREKTPDIILLDINMPKITGLELAEIVTKEYPDTKIILITGYDEFNYARTALRMGVEDYILKPVTRSEMVTLLTKTVEKLNQEKEEKEQDKKVSTKLKQFTPLAQQKCIEQLLGEEIDEKLLEKRLTSAEIPSGYPYYGIILIDGDNMLGREKDENKELTNFAIRNISNEIIEESQSGILFETDGMSAVLYFTNEEKAPLAGYQTALKNLKSTINENLGIGVTVAAGTLVRDIKDIKDSYNMARQALASRFFLGADRIIIKEEESTKNVAEFNKWLVWEERLLECIAKDLEIEDVLQDICIEMQDNNVGINNAKEIWGHLMVTMLKKFVELDDSVMQCLDGPISINEEIHKRKTLQEIKTLMIELYNKCSIYIQSESTPNKIHLKNILNFVEHNYHITDLNIQLVCDNVYLSYSHFSSIFKKETGKTFIQYLTEYRLEKAKHMLQYTGLKTYEIAERIGYADARYFSSLFKKQFNMTPSQYRNESK